MISKKDLLIETNISYGQLYRWKREGLIPDEWFIKKSVSTGQETYFDEELIIPRIHKILELKDLYQLDELKAFLSQDINKKLFNIKEIILIEEIDPYILKEIVKDKKELNIIELVLVYIFSISKGIDYKDIIDNIKIKDLNLDSKFYVLEKDSTSFYAISSGDVIFDKSVSIKGMMKFEDVAAIIAKKIGV